MAYPEFTFKPSFSLNHTVTPRVNTLTLGDGYADVTPIGLRPLLRSWSLQFLSLRLDEAEPILNFFRELGGSGLFRWTPPHPDRREGVWRVVTYSVSRPNGIIYNVSATFGEQ